MWGGQACEDRIGLDEDVGRHAGLAGEHGCGRAVTLMPGGKARHHDARVDGDQRRVLSMVARTSSSVSGGSWPSGTATGPPVRSTRDIGVGAGSISIRPSLSRISTASPRARPRRSRNGLGMTTRPAESMADLMPLFYHLACQGLQRSSLTRPPPGNELPLGREIGPRSPRFQLRLEPGGWMGYTVLPAFPTLAATSASHYVTAGIRRPRG